MEGFAPGVQTLVKILALSPFCTLSYSPVRLGGGGQYIKWAGLS
jgi:hypothetical protein